MRTAKLSVLLPAGLAHPLVTLLAYAVFATLASAQAQTERRFEDTAALASKDGIWLVGKATGRVKYCGSFKGAVGAAVQVKCSGPGTTIGPSSNGYDFNPIGSDLFAVNKTSGDIALCTAILDGYVRTTCQPVSKLDASVPSK